MTLGDHLHLAIWLREIFEARFLFLSVKRAERAAHLLSASAATRTLADPAPYLHHTHHHQHS